MKSSLGHIGINLSTEDGSFSFWRDLLRYLGFHLDLDGNHFDASDGHSGLCMHVTKPGYQQPQYHRRRTGLEHIAFKVGSAADVDRFVSEFLNPRTIVPLYGGARAYPEYGKDYYAVYFEDSDRIKIEVMFEGGNGASGIDG